MVNEHFSNLKSRTISPFFRLPTAILKLSIIKKRPTISVSTQMLELKSLENENILQLLSKSFEQSSLQVYMGKQVEKINYHKCTGLEQKYRTILQCVLL